MIFRTLVNFHGAKSFFIILIIDWLIFIPWFIRLFEARQAILEANLESYDYGYFDMIYLVIITLTSVGYGDPSPSSSYGKCFAIITGIFGVFLSAWSIVLFTSAAIMSKRERLLYRTLSQDNSRHELREKAAILLQKTFRRYKSGFNILQNPSEIPLSGSKYKKLKDRLKTERRKSLAVLSCPELANYNKTQKLPIVYSLNYLQAVRAFKKVRLTIKYSDDILVDNIDLSMSHSELLYQNKKLTNIVMQLTQKIESLDEKVNMLVNKNK